MPAINRPIEFGVIKDLQAALQAIDQADGYHHTVTAASVKLDPNESAESQRASGGQRPYIMIELGEDAHDQAERPMGVQLELPLIVHWIHDAADNDDDSLLLTYLQGCSDVEKAIAIDVSRGGRASNTRITSRRLEFTGSEVWALIGVVVRLRRGFGEPNEA